MSINHDGKQECIDNEVIKRSHSFLIDSPDHSYEDALNTSLIIMSCSIHLQGKNQIVNADHHGSPYVICTMISRLESDEHPDLRKNLITALTNVAELPLGFEKITSQLIHKIQILDEVFGARAVKTLHGFLPRLSDYDETTLNYSNKAKHIGQAVIPALAYLFKKYKEEAVQVAIDDTINFSEKLAPFINPEYGMQKEVFFLLAEILPNDPYNCHILQKFIKTHGKNLLFSRPDGKRTLEQEMYHECNEILELVLDARIIIT
jgi:hypothetical protein